jgi:hypothetical protein
VSQETKFDICSRALIEVGANVITSFDDQTTESIVAGQVYEPKLRSILTTYRWRFAVNQFRLNRLTDTPTGRWSYAYQLPPDALAINAVTRAGSDVIYDIYGDKIFTDEDDDLIADYMFRAPESKFPPAFTEAFVVELAAGFAFSIARNRELSKDLHTRADEVLWPKARSIDSQQQTSRKLPTSRLISVRG